MARAVSLRAVGAATAEFPQQSETLSISEGRPNENRINGDWIWEKNGYGLVVCRPFAIPNHRAEGKKTDPPREEKKKIMSAFGWAAQTRWGPVYTLFAISFFHFGEALAEGRQSRFIRGVLYYLTGFGKPGKARHFQTEGFNFKILGTTSRGQDKYTCWIPERLRL